jgi:putative oxidoreductase
MAIGLLTRPAALFGAVTMAVAFFVHHSGDPFGDRELAMLYGTVMLAFALLGSGKASLDHLLR